MLQGPNVSFDQSVLEMIEHSPTGAVPHTPTYQDALRRLYASRQVYASADHKDGHVTARSLADRPLFHAHNLDDLAAGRIEPDALEPNSSIFARYSDALPTDSRARAESHRVKLVGRPIHHRKHHGDTPAPDIHDPVHSLFLVPGAGPRPGLPGNYLHGVLLEIAGQGIAWTVQVHDAEDGVWAADAATLAEAVEKVQEVLASAPFHLEELEALGFRSL